MIVYLLKYRVFRKSSTPHWKIEYEYSVYKIHDKDNDLTGFFLPRYSLKDSGLDEDGLIWKLVDSQLSFNIKRAEEWRDRYPSNKERYEISKCLAYTAREHGHMLNVVMS